MNFLSLFVLIPLLMLGGLYLAKSIKAIRGVMVAGSTALLILSVVLTFLYLGERQAGATAEMLFRADTVWYAPLHIAYSVGVDGISVAMLLLSAVIVFTGTFASWKLQPLTKNISCGSPSCRWEYSVSLSPSTYSPCSCSTKSH